MKIAWKLLAAAFRDPPVAPAGRHRVRLYLERLEKRLAPAGHDTLGSAMPLTLDSSQPVQVSGILADADQVALYSVSLQAGGQVVADVTAAGTGSLAASLRIFDGTGRQLAFQENTGGDDTTTTFDALAAGAYYIGVSSNGNYTYDTQTPDSGSGGLTSGAYQLTLTLSSILQTESASNDSLGTAQPISANTVLAGTAVTGTTEYYNFTTASAGGLTASVTAAAGAAFVPRLTLYGDSGQLLIQSDAVGPDTASAQIVQHLQPGTYYLGVSAEPDAASGSQSYVLDAVFGPALPAFQALPTGNGPDAVATGDFNHDGNLDIVAANYTDNTVSVFLGNGDGTFQPAVVYAVGNGPDSVAVGDFNHDGNLDIVTANAIDDTVSVLLGNGDGTFKPAVAYAVGNYPIAVAVGDFTHDGNLDIVTANIIDNTVSVLLGNGDGTFRPAVAYAVGSNPYSLAVGEFTHDGNLDIVTANSTDGTVSVLLGNGDGTFQPAAAYDVGDEPYSVAVGDFNDDGNVDIVAANDVDNTVSVLLGNGDGTFQPAVAYGVGDGPSAVAVADLRDDGKLDIITANYVGNTVSVLLGNGDGTFQPAVAYASGNGAEAVVVGDFTQGHADIVSCNVANNSLSVLLGRGDGTFQPISSLVVGSAPFSVATGDFNHDGNLDLVTANYGDNTVSVLLGRGDGTFLPAVTYAVGDGPESVAVGDFNDDGNLDIVTANLNDNTVSVLLGRGDGTFLPAVAYSVEDSSGHGQWPYCVAVGDFTNDGNLDIVTANDNDNTVSVLLGNGDGTFRPAVTYNVGGSPHSVVVGDFTGNGILDLATANYTDNTVSVLLGRGNGTFEPAIAYRVGNNPECVTVGDFTGDGILDLATANSSDNTVSVLLGRGDGTFLPAVAYPVGNSPESVTVGDFTNDGNLDLATANYQDNTVSVLLGNGDGTFLSADTYAVGNNPYSVTVGDFNNAGLLDIVTTNYGDSTLSVLLGNGQSLIKAAALYATGKSPAAVAIGNDSQGNSVDIVTANQGDNTVTVLLGTDQNNAGGDGTFQSAVTCAVGDDPVAVASGNDSAGNLVIVTANAGDNTVSVLVGNVDGTFAPAASYSVGDDPVGVAVADFNGALVIATANAGNNMVSVLQGNADDTFQPAVEYPVGNDPDGVAMGIDAAGNLNIIAANAGDNTVSIWQQTPTGLVAPAVSYPVGDDPDAVAVSPDANGNLVVATANAGDNTVSVLQGNSAGTFAPVGAFPVGKDPIAVVVGYDNFGNFGLVTANAGDNTVSVLHAVSNGGFQSVATVPLGARPSAMAVGAFNSDANFEIFTTSAAANTVSVLFAGAQFQLSTPASGVAIRNIPYLQDLTGDGIPDELILNGSGVLLFRRGLPGAPDQFAPPVPLNAGLPARDATLYRTAAGWAVAAVAEAGDTVTLYQWNATAQAFQSAAGFATGSLPVRIAAADLTGNGLDDLVVANDFDNTVTIAFQQPDGTFKTIVQPVGAGPSGIAFANLGGANGPDIVVSDQVSGDFSVLFNDPAHSFSEQSRYRAGSGLFDIAVTINDQTVQSTLQTVGVVAGPFTGSGSDDVITLNRGAESFTLFRDQGQGRFPSPQPGDTYFPTSDQPSQIVAFTLPGDTLPSVAILMQDLGQIWIYRNNGDGTFAAPTVVDAGNDSSGFSVATVDGQLALLVGNAYGDILTLLYDGHGGFAPDRANLQNAPLAVGTIAATGQQFAVVADQGDDQVSLYYRIPGTDSFGDPITVSGTSQLPLLAPGAVQTFHVAGDANPYLAVANSLSNNVLLYHYDPATAGFVLLQSYPVGDNPVSITVADVNGNGIPDLLVANYGSNDVSVLIGQKTRPWTAIPYQRLDSDGSGPIAVAVRPGGGSAGPDLLVTNSNGTVALLPGIGSDGKGSGFFQGDNAQLVSAGEPLSQAIETDGRLLVVSDEGRVLELAGDHFTSLVDTGVATLSAFGDFLVAGLDDGAIELLGIDGTVLVSAETDFTEQVNALQVLGDGRILDVYATEQGGAVPVIVSLPLPTSLFIPAVPGLSPAAPEAQTLQLAGAELVLVGALLPGGLVELPSSTFAVAVAGLIAPPAQGNAPAITEPVPNAPVPVAADTAERPGWERYLLGVPEAGHPDAPIPPLLNPGALDPVPTRPDTHNGPAGSLFMPPPQPAPVAPVGQRTGKVTESGAGSPAERIASAEPVRTVATAAPDESGDEGGMLKVGRTLAVACGLLGSILGARLVENTGRIRQQAKKSWAKKSWAKKSWAKKSWAKKSWAKKSWAKKSWAKKSWAKKSWAKK